MLSVLEAAGESPDRPAVVCERGSVSYQALARDVRTAIEGLRGRGVSRNDLVALVPRVTFDEVLWIYALMEMRVPMALLHPRLTLREREEFLRATGAAWLIDGAKVLALRADRAKRIPDDVLALVSTSGTTGRPKVVMLGREAFEASARASEANLGWQSGDRWLLAMPLAHVGGLSVVTRCLIGRQCVVLGRSATVDLDDICTAIDRDGVTIASLVPTTLHRLLRRIPRWEPPAHVRAMLVGGAHASSAMMRSARERGWPVVATYGLTEACSQVATQTVGGVSSAGVGRALPGIEVRVVAGEIQVRGATMMRGYLGGQVAQVEGGWFPTGDLGRLDEGGNLHVGGRLTDRIVRGGENVDPAEVEEQIGRCEGVAAVCVFGVDDDEWGQVVAAAIVGEANVERVAEEVRGTLAGYKCPAQYCRLSTLVVTGAGKVDRAATARVAAGVLRRV